MGASDLFILGILIGGLLLYFTVKGIGRLKLKGKMNRARKAEGRALKALHREGYEILEIQKRIPFVTIVDGKPYKNYLQADYIVAKNGLRYVVEVKTGDEATQITTAQTRRQLLEYYLIYRPDGILLMDMECGEIREVCFQVDLPLWTQRKDLIRYIVVFALGGLTVFLLLKGGLWQ